MKTVKSSAVIVSAILLVCVILCTGCPNASGGAKPPADSASSPGGGGTPTPPAVEKITITVAGDANVTVSPSAAFTVDKGTKWKDIRAAAEAKVSYRDGYDDAGWKRTRTGGVYIDDEIVFTKDTTVFAVSKIQGTEPARVIISVKGDENVTVTVVSAHTLTADKGAKWKDIRAAAEAKVSYKDGYGAAGWRFEDGTNITDETVFGEDKTVFAVSGSKPAGKVRLIIRGDERTNIASPDFIDVNTGKTWAQVKDEAALKVSLKSGWTADEYGVYEWRLTDEDGAPIDAPLAGGYTFSQDTTVYAVTNYTKFNIAAGVVKGYTGDKPKGKIIIPADVTEIAVSAFQDCTSLTGVNFPASLKKIGRFAFKNCTGLTSLTLPSSLEEIGSFAFDYCIEVAGTVSIPVKLKTISWAAFRNCKKVRDFDFSRCTQLTSIDTAAFYNCTGITQAELPRSLKTIEGDAFANCTGLTRLTVDPASAHLCAIDNIVYTADQKKLLCRIPNVTSFPFSADLEEIGSSAFSFCTSLTSVNFPASLKKIGSIAFSNCTGLASLTLPSSLEKIGDLAFTDCTEVAGTVSFQANLKTIGQKAFRDCKKVRDFDFSACTTQLTSIGSDAFSGCTAARFKVKKDSTGDAIKQKLIASGVATGQIEGID